MNGDHNKDFDDDGRTVADMSFLEDSPITGTGAVFSWSAPDHKEVTGGADYSGNLPELGKKGRGAAFRGALGATLLIGAVYIAAAAGLIGIMIFVWSVI